MEGGNLSPHTSILSNLLGKHLSSVSSHLVLDGLEADKLYDWGKVEDRKEISG